MTAATITYKGNEYEIAPIEPLRSDVPASGIFVITPAVAESWNGYNRHNRNKRETGSRDYGADMKNEDFELNGETIKLSRPLLKGENPKVPEGHIVIIDGQHRLDACIKSGKPFVTFVAYGLPPEVIHTVDSGIKRQFKDSLSLSNEKDTALLGSTVRQARAWEMGDQRFGSKSRMTKPQGRKFLADHPELRRSVEVAQQTRHDNPDVRPTVTAVAHWLFMKAEPELAPEFFARVGDGANLDRNHPIMQLRRRLTKDVRSQKVEGRSPDWRIMAYYIRTWNATLANNENFVLFAPGDANSLPEIKTRKQVEEELAKADRLRATREANG